MEFLRLGLIKKKFYSTHIISCVHDKKNDIAIKNHDQNVSIYIIFTSEIIEYITQIQNLTIGLQNFLNYFQM